MAYFPAVFAFTGCAGEPPPQAPPVARDRITQVSVINALMVGRYDGVTRIGELLRDGDFGLGTLDHLDGELIVLGGEAFQARSDGSVVKVGAGQTTPFAVITTFEQDDEFGCRDVKSLSDLDALIEARVARKNSFFAVRVDGRFASVTIRSVGRQEPPYRPLAEVAKGQSVWSKTDLVGTLLGVHSPAWAGGITVPGFHWHFLSGDRKVGGHVLDLELTEARAQYDLCTEWRVKLDDSPAFNAADLAKDQSRDLHRVESSRGGAADGKTAPDPRK